MKSALDRVKATVVVDRPILFAIVDLLTRAILSLGRAVEPASRRGPKSSGLVVVFGGVSGSFRRSAALRASR